MTAGGLKRYRRGVEPVPSSRSLKVVPIMLTPDQQITAFLTNYRVPDARALTVAVALTESMILELQAALAQWQAQAGALDAMKRQAAAARN